MSNFDIAESDNTSSPNMIRTSIIITSLMIITVIDFQFHDDYHDIAFSYVKSISSIR